LYVYDATTMRRQYNKLLHAFSGSKVKLFYAAKALTNLHVLNIFKELGSGLDAVSIEEVQLALMAGFEPDQILFTPNCVSFAELEEAIKMGVNINIDNISLLEQFGHRYGHSVPVCIRVNPHILAGGHYKISTGHIDSKFGISIHQMRHIERLVQTFNLDVAGLHMHTGSDILDVEVFLNGADILFELALRFPDIRYLDFGSGFKVAYKNGDITTDIVDLGKRFTIRYQEFCKNFGKEIDIHFEPGKFLVSEAGYFLTRTNVVKHTTATVFAGVDSGFNHLIRPVLYDAYHHISNLSNPHGKDRIYTVVGYVCETDTFASDRQLKEVHEGDILCFHNAGAYGIMMASNYNSRLKPAEVLVDGEKESLIRRRETLQEIGR